MPWSWEARRERRLEGREREGEREERREGREDREWRESCDRWREGGREAREELSEGRGNGGSKDISNTLVLYAELYAVQTTSGARTLRTVDCGLADFRL